MDGSAQRVVRFDLVSIGDQSRQALTRGTNQRKRLQQRAKHGARSLFNLEGIRPWAVDMGP